jgi:hypothetical protein
VSGTSEIGGWEGEEGRERNVVADVDRISDAMTLFQARPLMLSYVSEKMLGEPMSLIQKYASCESLTSDEQVRLRACFRCFDSG